MPDIVLKNKDGEDVTYSGIETVTFDTPTQEKGATFTYGTAVSDIPIELNLASGNQRVSVPEGVLVKSGIIQKPSALTPENIKSGVEIAGVTGNFIGNALENIPIELDLVDGNQTITAPDGYLVKSAIIQKPEGLLPENIAVGVEIGGVVGTFQGGGKVVLDEELKYLNCYIDPVAETVMVEQILFDKIYADTGSYDVAIPDTLLGYPVVIKTS